MLSFISELKIAFWHLALFAFIHWSPAQIHFISRLWYCVMCELVFWDFPNDLLISCYYYAAHRLQPRWCHHLSHLSCEIVLIAVVAALHFFPSLLLAWTSLGVSFPWPSTVTCMHLRCYCYVVFWVFLMPFSYILCLSFFQSPLERYIPLFGVWTRVRHSAFTGTFLN